MTVACELKKSSRRVRPRNEDLLKMNFRRIVFQEALLFCSADELVEHELLDMIAVECWNERAVSIRYALVQYVTKNPFGLLVCNLKTYM